MTKSRNTRSRRAQIAFLEAIRYMSIDYATAMLDHLSIEFEMLGEVFKKDELPLNIRGSWIEHDLSYVVVIEKPFRDGEVTPFLKLQMTPLSNKEAQIVASYLAQEIVKKYHYMDKECCTDRMLVDIRNHILVAVPYAYKDSVEAILLGMGVKEPRFKDYKSLKNTISWKYQGTENPHNAYVESLNYQ